jgi:hypothetical protein
MTIMATNARNVRIENRSRIAAQNLMEGDEVLMRGELSVFVERISRSEARGTVTVTYSNGTRRKFEWNERVSIGETPQRHLYRRNSLRRKGYRNYLKEVLNLLAKPKANPTPKRKPKKKSRR